MEWKYEPYDGATYQNLFMYQQRNFTSKQTFKVGLLGLMRLLGQ